MKINMTFKEKTWVLYKNEPYYLRQIFNSGSYLLITDNKDVKVKDISSLEPFTPQTFNCGDIVIYYRDRDTNKYHIGTVKSYDELDNYRPYLISTPGLCDWWPVASKVNKIDL